MFYIKYYHFHNVTQNWKVYGIPWPKPRLFADIFDMPVLKLWAFAEHNWLINDRNQGLDEWFYNATDKIWKDWNRGTTNSWLSTRYHRRSVLANRIREYSHIKWPPPECIYKSKRA